MGLGYTYQNTLVLIGSKNATTHARTSVALPTAYDDATTTKTLATGGMSKANFGILYTTGAAETNNSIEIRIESSPDRTNWYRLPNESVSAGTSTLTQREFTFVGASAGTAYDLSLPIDVQDEFLRVSIKESGVAANAGTIYLEVTLSGCH